MPCACSVSTHAPSDPSCGQLPPPRASTVASAANTVSPEGVSNRSLPSPVQPAHR